MRAGVVFLLFAMFSVLATACDPGIGITIVNRTASKICWYESEKEVGNPKWCADVQPGQTVEYSTICTSDWQQLVLLTIGAYGPQIYKRSATCGEWEQSGARVTVTQSGEEFIVTDSLPD